MKSILGLFVGVAAFGGTALADAKVFYCSSEAPGGGYPLLATYIERDSPTGTLFSHVGLREVEGTTLWADSETLTYAFANQAHEFKGQTYALIVTASRDAAECGDGWDAQCAGQVTFRVRGETQLRKHAVMCHAEYR